MVSDPSPGHHKCFLKQFFIFLPLYETTLYQIQLNHLWWPRGMWKTEPCSNNFARARSHFGDASNGGVDELEVWLPLGSINSVRRVSPAV